MEYKCLQGYVTNQCSEKCPHTSGANIPVRLRERVGVGFVIFVQSAVVEFAGTGKLDSGLFFHTFNQSFWSLVISECQQQKHVVHNVFAKDRQDGLQDVLLRRI